MSLLSEFFGFPKSPEQKVDDITEQALLRICPVQVITIKEGDLVVFSYPKVLSIEAYHRLRDGLTAAGLGSNKVIILENGLHLDVVLQNNT